MSDFPIELVLLLMVIGGIVAISAWLIATLGGNKREAAPPAPTPMAATPTTETAEKDIIRLRRTGEQWELWVKGTRYRALSEITHEPTRQEFLAALRMLATFAREGWRQETPVATAAPAPAAPPATSSPSASPAVTAPSALTANPTPAAGGAPRLPVAPPREQELRVPARPPSLIPVIDLAREIGEIVEARQAQIPELAHRSIRLRNAPGGGVYFAVDGISYTTVEEIPDPAIQALIRAATKEWERR